MLKLYGIMHADKRLFHLKCQALLFDKFLVWGVNERHFIDSLSSEREGELDFLIANQVVLQMDLVKKSALERYAAHNMLDGLLNTFGASGPHPSQEKPLLRDCITRMFSIGIKTRADSAPICEVALPKAFACATERSMYEDTLKIALTSLPVPSEHCAWEDILAFKKEHTTDHWGFRRFLRALATKQQSAAEIRDDIEWSLNEYTEAMKRYSIKTTPGIFEAYVIPTIKVIEGLPSLKISRFLEARLAVKKHQVQILEAEANMPGRECAYLFAAHKRFRRR